MSEPITRQYTLLGLTCISCSQSAETNLLANPGVELAKVNFGTHTAEIRFRPDTVGFETLQDSLRPLGYTLVSPEQDAKALAREYVGRLRRRTLFAGAVGLPLGGLDLLGVSFPGLSWVGWALTTAVLWVSGRELYRSAVAQLRQGFVSMDVLVVLGISAAWGISSLLLVTPGLFPPELHLHSESAAVILFFILLGRYLEEEAKRVTVDDYDAVEDLSEQPVTVLREGIEIRIKAAQVQPGEILRLPAGARIPVDGTVREGNSYVNESMLTGEPLPVHKRVGDTLTAGTSNGEGELLVEVIRAGEATTYYRFATEVRRAQQSRSHVQRIIDRFVRYYVPGVTVLASATFLGWVFLGGESGFAIGTITGLTVLIVSCPCALGLATPVVVRLGISRAAQMGLLITDAGALETAGTVDTVFLDKTGTLTLGQPEVVRFQVDPEAVGRSGTFLPGLVTLSGQSVHPLSKAIRRYLLDRHLGPVFVSAIRERPGEGVEGTVDGLPLRLGSIRWLVADGCTLRAELAECIKTEEKSARTIVGVAYGPVVVAIFVLEDPINPTAFAAIGELHALGLKTVLLTGDQRGTAEAVARAVGVAEVGACLTPQEKAARVESAVQEGRRPAFLGDGINDSLAMARAHLGMAMAGGADLARQSSGVVVVGGNLSGLAPLFRLGRRARALIRQNLLWAVGYNLVALPLATGLFYPQLMWPTVAALAMAGSSLAVVLNSVRLTRWRAQSGGMGRYRTP